MSNAAIKYNDIAVTSQDSLQANSVDKLVERYGEQVKHSLNSTELVDTELNGNRTTKFQPGNQAALGAKRGKQRLSAAFVDDLTFEWHRRGMQALQDLDSKALVQACVAILPKDILMSVDQSAKVQFVINAAPQLSTSEWLELHGLNRTIDTQVIDDTSD